MRASAISIDVSPQTEVVLGASKAGRHRWLGITEPIEANLLALWFDDDRQAPILLVSLDLLYPGRILRAAVESAAQSVPSERIFVAASHTHRAPMTDDTKPRLGSVDHDYITWLTQKLSEAVARVLEYQSSEPIFMSIAQAEASHSINRRRKKRFVLARKPLWNAYVNAPNPVGTTDENVLTVSLRRESGEPLALMWNYACHPVGFPLHNTIAGHYPVVVRDALRSKLTDRELPVLFFQGFSGNTRPRATAKVHSFKRLMRRVVSGPLFEDMTEDSYKNWTGSLSDIVLGALAEEVPFAPADVTAKRMLANSVGFGEPAPEPVSFQGIHFGDELSIVGVSGEAVAEYSTLVRAVSGAKYTFCVGCIDHPFGYLPSAQIQAEGGYEAQGFLSGFGLSRLSPDVESHTMNGFRSVMRADDSSRK